MKYLHNQLHTPAVSLRRGVTLTEVLMSLMIMSIGVSAVIVLFPISVLRSVQATQLTNAAILKRNIESELRQNPKLIFDPDGDYDLATDDRGRAVAIAEHFQGAAARNYIVDPAGFYAFFGQDNDGNGSADAADDPFAANFGNSISSPGFYVGTAPAGQRFLPRFDGRVMSTSGLYPLPRNSISWSPSELRALAELALKRARLGDGRTVQLDTFFGSWISRNLPGGPYGPAGSYIVGMQLSDTVSEDDLSQIPSSSSLNLGPFTPDPENSEIVIFSDSQYGTFSQTFPLTHVDASQRSVFWSEVYYDDVAGDVTRDFNLNGLIDLRRFPREFQGSPGRVVLRTAKAADFTWLLTVRRSSDGNVSGADIVVRHNVGITIEDERAFPAALQSDSRFVGVRNFDDGSAEGIPPEIKRGQFMLDPLNARWYRIAAVTLPPTYTITDPDELAFWGNSPGQGNFKYRVELETAVIQNAGQMPMAARAATATSPAVPAQPFLPSAVIFVPHIVDVYPLSSMTLPESL